MALRSLMVYDKELDSTAGDVAVKRSGRVVQSDGGKKHLAVRDLGINSFRDGLCHCCRH